MNIEKSVFNKLNKVELESQKFDFEKSYASILSEYKALETKSGKIISDLKDLVQAKNKIKSVTNNFRDEISVLNSEALKTIMAMNKLGLKDSKEWNDIRETMNKLNNLDKEVGSGDNFSILN